jgi:alpha-methylacyl-CoA racemase
MSKGPLSGLKIIEFAGIGPGPFCGMLLSDLGADVIRIDRKPNTGAAAPQASKYDVTTRGRRSIALDLKQPAAIEVCLRLIESADALFEGFRPGVMERLGLGPAVTLERNARLVFGRMTGWGQDGPYAQVAGHDINYIALTGALHAIGSDEKPAVPLNVVGDFGGGALYLAFGLLAAIIHARETGRGQVVDCAITDGVASLMAMIYGWKSSGFWTDKRGSNVIDGGSHFYNAYQCADGQWISIGPVEPQFYDLLLQKLEIDDPRFKQKRDKDSWPVLKARLTATFKSKTRAEWCALLDGTDVCFAPVLTMEEAPKHPHNIARGTFVEIEDVVQPGPAPRFSLTPGQIQRPPAAAGAHNDEVLADWGFSAAELTELRERVAL